MRETFHQSSIDQTHQLTRKVRLFISDPARVGNGGSEYWVRITGIGDGSSEERQLKSVCTRYLRIIMRQGFNGEGDDGRGEFQPNQLRVNGLI